MPTDSTHLPAPHRGQRRRDLIPRLAALVGPDLCTVRDPGNGWPGLIDLTLPSGPLTLAVHIGEIGLSHRGRDDIERRFQNPGQDRPMSQPAGTFPLLLGVWEGGRAPLLVGMEAEVRITRETRQSLFIPLTLLARAETTGWAEHVSGSGELLIAFHPGLLPVYVEARRQGIALPNDEISDIATAAGLSFDESTLPAERARRVAYALVRRNAFSAEVLAAYDGLCTVCDLDLGLVEGAHIYPVEAPASPDAVWNGLALCPNHHSAFDKHQLWINPTSLGIQLHPSIRAQAIHHPATQSFVGGLRAELRPPRDRALRPKSEMLLQRYEWYDGRYKWAG
jgi:hypothetical protein